MQSTKRSILFPALAIAAAMVGGQAFAQTSSTTTTTTNDREMQRGVPGVDVDVNRTGTTRDRGVPGVDVDVRSNTQRRDTQVDTRSSGASGNMASDTGTMSPRGARADRN